MIKSSIVHIYKDESIWYIIKRKQRAAFTGFA